MYKLKFTTIRLVSVFISAILLGSDSEQEWKSKLYIPTCIGKHVNNYIVVDCCHHRLIYSNKIDEDIQNWKTLDDEIAGPHSFSTHGDFLIAEDTGRDALILYKWNNGTYTLET